MLEMLTSIAVIIVIAIAIIVSITLYQGERALGGGAAGVVSTLEQARSQALSSRNQMAHGVHFETDRYTLFEGDGYVAGAAANEVFVLPAQVEISGWVLTGGGADVVFNRLTGATSMAGTITLRIKNNASRTKTITVLETGIISSN